MLSEALNEKVSKTNVRSVLERQWRRQSQGSQPDVETLHATSLHETSGSKESQENLIPNHTDWEEAADVSVFYRTSNLCQVYKRYPGDNFLKQPCPIR